MTINQLFNYKFSELKNYEYRKHSLTIEKAKGFRNALLIRENGNPIVFVNDTVSRTCGMLSEYFRTGKTNILNMENF